MAARSRRRPALSRLTLLALAGAAVACAAGCGSRVAADDAPAPLSTGIPVGAPGAVGLGFDAPAVAAPAGGTRRTPPKHKPRPLPPDPFEIPDHDTPPIVPKPPAQPKGVNL